MTLAKSVRTGGIVALVFFGALIFFLATNQHSALAGSTDIFGKFGQITQSLPEVPPLPETNPDLNNLVEEELCKIYTRLNEAGEPIPEFDTEGCGEEGENPPPPPPPPPPAGGVENTLALCTDGVDNDGDSKVDLQDPDCASFRPTLTITLVMVNDNGGTSGTSDFSLSVKMSSPGSSEAIGISQGVATALSAAGTWKVEGFQKSGYSATFSGDCSPTGEVTVAAGQTKSCTITSNDVAPSAPACSDGVDNDGDGSTDAIDPGCENTQDNDETDATGGSGDESTPPSSGGGGGGGGGGEGGGGLPPGTALYTSTTTGSGAGIAIGFSTTTESCDRYLTAFIRAGQVNDTDQVKRLQRFLRDFEGAQVTENGIYDGATLAAVHAFQIKYGAEILAPWGIGKSTGYVYLTTRKKVNEIFCRNTKVFYLTVDELKKIEEGRAASTQTAGVPASAAQSASAASAAQPKTPATEATKNVATGTGATTTSDQAGPLDRVMRFFRGMFDRSR